MNTVSLVELKKKGSNSSSSKLPENHEFITDSTITTREANRQGLLQLKRVTVDMTEDAQVQTISANNLALAAFDIVAVQPATEKLLISAIQSTEIDLISFDVTKRLTYRIRAPVARQALDNGIMFEICIGDSLADPNTRKTAISNAKRIVEATKGKNIIISNGTSDPLLLRGPYDLINLAHFFGLTASEARKCLTNNPRELVLHALTRKTHRGVVDMSLVAQLDASLRWTVQERSLLAAIPSSSSAAPGSAMDLDEPVSAATASSDAQEPKKAKGKRKRDD